MGALFVGGLTGWHWLMAGALFLVLELLAPGVFMFWLGLAAVAVGLLSFIIDWSWQIQGLTFAVLAIAAIPLWRRFSWGQAAGGPAEFLNRRAEALVGRRFTLEVPIVSGRGTIRVDDTVWRVAGPDMPSGLQVEVVRADGADLHVARAAD